VDDVVEAMLLSAVYDGANGRIFNLGNTPRLVCWSLCARFSKYARNLAQGKVAIAWVPFPPIKNVLTSATTMATNGKIQKTLAWQPVVCSERGLRRTVAYYIQYGDHYWGEG